MIFLFLTLDTVSKLPVVNFYQLSKLLQEDSSVGCHEFPIKHIRFMMIIIVDKVRPRGNIQKGVPVW